MTFGKKRKYLNAQIKAAVKTGNSSIQN